MILRVIRLEQLYNATLGILLIDNHFACYTLEDALTPPDGKGNGRIPTGAFPVIITDSARFKRPLPLLTNVPGRDGIRIHCGNTDKDTIGCILVGMDRQKDQIVDSHSALEMVMWHLEAARRAGEKAICKVENVF